MARPRKNRVGEYAAQLMEELLFHLSKGVEQTVEKSQAEYKKEVARLQNDIRRLERRLEGVEDKLKPKKQKPVGRWVPGGPGRPPKDADERIAAFSNQKKRKTKKKR